MVIDYFAQDQAAVLNATRTVYEEMTSASPTTMVPMIRTSWAASCSRGDDVYKRVGVLSGGERNRLALAKMLLNPSNLLLLDEPTNHLDLDSKEVLLEALADYGGTLIFVSHDRYFVDQLASKVVDVGGGEALALPRRLRGLRLLEEAAGGGPGAAAAHAAGARPRAAPHGRRAAGSTTRRASAPAPAVEAAPTPARRPGRGQEEATKADAAAPVPAGSGPLRLRWRPRLRPRGAAARPPGPRARGPQAQGAR